MLAGEKKTSLDAAQSSLQKARLTIREKETGKKDAKLANIAQ